MNKKIDLSSTVTAAILAAVALTCCRPLQQGSGSISNLGVNDHEASLALNLQQSQTETVGRFPLLS